MTVDFVHLHLHSDYSMLDGACQVKRLCARVKELGQTAVAITDHGNMFATFDQVAACKGAGIKPIIGSEFYLTQTTISDRKLKRRNHLVLLAKNYDGFINLCHLQRAAWSDEGFYYKPRIDHDLLRKYSDNLVCMSACIGGEIQQHILNNDDVAARKSLEFYIDVFGKEDFYLEIQFHAKPGETAENARDEKVRELLQLEDKVNKKFLEFSREYGVELVCTNDAHYLNREDFEAHDALLCIGTQSQLTDIKRMKFSGDQFYVKSGEEMAELFKDYPRAVENTVKIAEKCNFAWPENPNHYPVYDLNYATDMAASGFAPELPEVKDNGKDAHCPIRRRYLLEICFKGLIKRYNLHEPENENYVPKSDDEPTAEFRKEILERMHFEMGIIDKMGFVSYFLVVWDFINYARSIDVPVGPGRGSGAGSIVAFLTGITDLDPLLYGLLFERFLNPDRVSPPDFDIDFCERRRGEVIEYVRNKYGSKSVAQIGTFGTLKAKAVIKDVSRVMGIDFAEVNSVVSLIPTDPKMTLKKALELEDVKAKYDEGGWVKDVFDKAQVLEGLNRNQSIHACGVIIGDQELANLVPLARGAQKEWITQFPAYPCEAIGLLKMDFLGLKTLTIIQDTLDLVNRTTGGNFTPDDISLTDKTTYNLLNKGETVGVFQLESGGMQALCRSFGIEKIEEIIALVALYRPGPMEFIPTFVDCKFGRQTPEYETKEMEELLSETYGIMVYQEQIMQVVQAVAGFSLAQADIMRRAIGKKKEAVLIEQGVKFVEGCLTQGHSKEIAESIWQKILKFAAYGFNKSHSACYGLLSYRTAYLKANHPAEFMAAVLNAEINNAEKLSFYISECSNMDIKILPPDVNVSLEKFSVDKGNIRFGIAGLKGVGTNAAHAIIEAQKDGPFKNMVDFCERTGSKVNKRVLENLTKAGGFDAFGLHRSQVFAIYEQAFQMAQGTIKDRERGQASLFDMFGDEETSFSNDVDIPDIPEWDEQELLAYEKELLGLYVSGHPLGDNAQLIRKFSTHSIPEILNLELADTPILCGGMIKEFRPLRTKKGAKMAVIKIEDLTSEIEVVIFPKSYEKCKELIAMNAIIYLSAFTQVRDGAVTLICEEVFTVKQMLSDFCQEVHLRLWESPTFGDEQFSQISELASKYRGYSKLIFCVTCENGDVAFIRSGPQFSVEVSPEFIAEASHLFGKKSLHYKLDTDMKPVKKQRSWKKPAPENAD